MKQCSKCKTIKTKDKFKKAKRNKDGINCVCKECVYLQELARYRTKPYVVKLIYSNQKVNSKYRGHKPPTYSAKELKEWLYSQEEFHILYDNWKRLDYQKMYKPSTDRKDNNIGYTIANIKLMTFGDNLKNATNDIVCGRTKTTKAILQYTKSGILLNEYISTAQAEKETGISKSAICYNLKNKTKHSGGFVWEYKDIK